MATPLKDVISIMETFKSTEVAWANLSIPISHAKLGVIQASIPLLKDFNLTSTMGYDDSGNEVEIVTITETLTAKELYLCGLFAFRDFAMQEHHTLTQKAVNFKTINFAVTGLTERAKEMMRIVWWCDTEIERTLNNLRTPMGNSHEMRGDAYER